MEFAVKIFLFVVYASLIYASQESGTLEKRQVLLLNNFRQVRTQSLLVTEFFGKNNVTEIIFVPYAKVSGGYDLLTTFVQEFLFEGKYTIKGLHSFPDPYEAVRSAQGLFVIGGNSFGLLKSLYDLNLIGLIRKRVLEDGIPYMGSSAGSNVATRSIQTSNDMPIVYPPSFDALNLVPFNINAHYSDSDDSKHRGAESRDDRLREFHYLNDSPVLALRGGTLVLIDDDKATLGGSDSGRLFTRHDEPKDFEPGSDLTFLLQQNQTTNAPEVEQ